MGFGYLRTKANALCCYTNVKWEIRNLIIFIAPIFLQFNYFRQNLDQNFTFTFYFFSFASNFPCKYYETIKILMQIFVYFRSHFHYWAPAEKKFEVFSEHVQICLCNKSQVQPRLKTSFLPRESRIQTNSILEQILDIF